MADDRNPWRDALGRLPDDSVWRGLDELSALKELSPEFPSEADSPAALTRRELLRLMSATAALAGLAGCMSEPRSRIRSQAALTSTPGTISHYATALFLNGYAEGLIAKTLDGRPLKLDGHPEHPATLGGSSIHLQALLFELYDPQRARAVLHNRSPSSWPTYLRWAARPRAKEGAGLCFLLGPSTSPSMAAILARIHTRAPASRFYFHSFQPTTDGPWQLRYDLRKAKVICSFAEDLLGPIPFGNRYARQFADGRRLLDGAREMNRLYVIESDLSVTGMSADHRLALKPSAVRSAARDLLAFVLEGARRPLPLALRRGSHANESWLRAVASDLLRHPGESLVVAGADQPPEVHAVVRHINEALGANGSTVTYAKSPLLEAGGEAWDLSELLAGMKSGAVDELVILEGNPAVTAGEDFRALLPRVRQVTYAGTYHNATAQAAEWFLPVSQPLERWEDGRAVDGTLSFAQPVIRPLYDTRSPLEILAAHAGHVTPDGHDLLLSYWRGRAPLEPPGAWDEALQQGFVPGTAAGGEARESNADELHRIISEWKEEPAGAYELSLRPDHKVLDGRFANNLWLLELADPVTKLTWENAALVSPGTAATLRLESGQQIRIRGGTRELVIPVLVLPGHADGAITIPIGFGASARSWGGNWMEGDLGVDPLPLRQQRSVTIEALATRHELALTQTHWSMEGRAIGVTRTLAHYNVPVQQEPSVSLLPVVKLTGDEQWGLAIDLNVCTGCSACVVACQAENNIPVVGKAGVLKSREMHWIRIDRYFSGSPASPSVVVQPMLCQHCEKAPCEYVCPVNATTHSPDGLNEQTYNRCVGTRFCQNNCPYKVRRFNWFDYNIRKPPEQRLMMNPDVTVRARGVIEKCTYCVQRIREGQITARKERRPVKDQEIRTACQDACPSGAIAFGNLADSTSQVSRWMRQPRTYSVLSELGTQPRTRYLTKVSNPNPDLT